MVPRSRIPRSTPHFSLIMSAPGHHLLQLGDSRGAPREEDHGAHVITSRKEPVRFDSVSVPDFSRIHRFGSVRFGKLHFQIGRGSARIFRTRRGLVRFVSVRFFVRFLPVPELIGSVQFGSACSVRFLIPC